MSLPSLMKQPSAFLPPLMSLAALGTVLLHVVRFGVTHDLDEGAAAHTWQLLMAGQLPLMGYFAIKWLPQAPRKAMAILAVDLLASAAAVAPVFLLKL